MASSVSTAASSLPVNELSASNIGVKAEWTRPGRTEQFQLRSIGSPDGVFPAAVGRYHLYAPFNCPWSHRTILARAILGLEGAISHDVPLPTRTEDDHPDGKNRWQFSPDGVVGRNGRLVRYSSCTADTVHELSTVHQIYNLYGVEQNSCPLLVDKLAPRALVNNESADIMRMMITAMRHLGTRPLDLYPEALRPQIDELNAWIYTDVCNGAYKAGFTGSQDAYEKAYLTYFRGFERLDSILAGSRFLCGEAVTEADLPIIFACFPRCTDMIRYTTCVSNSTTLSCAAIVICGAGSAMCTHCLVSLRRHHLTR